MTGIRKTTATAYTSSQRSFIGFCSALRLTPLPASEHTVLLYIAWLNRKGLAPGSFNVHLSGIRNLHIINNHSHEHIRSDRVKLALRSIALNAPAPVQKDPIDFKLLTLFWPAVKSSVNSVMWQALLSLAFFGGLRGAEYTQNKSSGKYPIIQSVTFSKSGKVVNYKVQSSKTVQHGFTSVLGCSDNEICAPCTMSRYIRARLKVEQVLDTSWLFVDIDGKPISKAAVDRYLKSLAQGHSLDPSKYSTHSLRAGAATSAASAGCKEYEIQAIGGWKSQTYTRYIRNTKEITRDWPKALTRDTK